MHTCYLSNEKYLDERVETIYNTFFYSIFQIKTLLDICLLKCKLQMLKGYSMFYLPINKFNIFDRAMGLKKPASILK